MEKANPEVDPYFPQLTFIDMNLEMDTAVAVDFRRDSFVASFGDSRYFDAPCGAGADQYLKRMRKRIAAWPGSCVHVWLNDRIIGQIEVRPEREMMGVGYVNLFYLVPEYRGKGFSRHLQTYVADFFRSHGMDRAHLNVSPTNQRAIGFYEKMGWIDTGPVAGADPIVHLMTCRF